jgi:hypothetical protein
MKAGLGVRLVAGAAFLAGALAATFLAGAAAFLAGAALVAGAAFLAGAAAFLAGVFFAVAMMKFLWSEVGSPLRNDVFTAIGMLMEKVALSKHKNHFSLDVVADLPSLFGFCWSWQLSSSCFYAICRTSKGWCLAQIHRVRGYLVAFFTFSCSSNKDDTRSHALNLRPQN